MPTTDQQCPIGLLGGTFDPIHIGHLRVAVEVREALGLDEIRLIPLNQPGHKAAAVASAAHRLSMLRLIAQPQLTIEDCEITRGGTTYTVDTLTELRSRWRKRSLCLIIGHDAFVDLPSWHRVSELLGLAHLVVVTRPQAAGDPKAAGKRDAGAALAMVNQCITDRPQALLNSAAGQVLFLPIPEYPVSSSDIRQRVANGRDIRFLVPEPIHQYIAKQRLYQS